MKKSARGVPREGAGRPRIESEAQIRRNITISNRIAIKAKKIGDGNISEGIRRAIEAF